MHIPMQLKIVIFACLILHINIGYADDFKERKLKKVKSKTSKKLYLKVGVGNMHYRKFIETAQYERKSLRTDTTYNIGIGHKFNTSIKADINLQYHKTKYVDIDHNPLFNLTFNSKQKINILSIFINGYYGFNFNKFIIPYITVGLGVGKNKARDLVVEPMDPILDAFKGKTIKNFIWNTGAGIECFLNDHLSLNIEYKYAYLGKIKVKNNTMYDGATQKIRGSQITGFFVYTL